ncbi:hypothetical protein [Methanocella arvoryzae]|uniref:Methyltransferase n=1 Tax=Methanocella arvoryzae (strain DSM 22066 / NBRC 105507 / MRE50) TaxID=351160 RepID=Q0W179_METAR|nr:hypothetical protein [Methanocella arvoryzae]CAJ37864.1 conserved hypothetical protein [Methanocella arvoryzae MRE50]
MFPCPTCGSPDCIRPMDEILAEAPSMYVPCSTCVGDKPLDKMAPFRGLGVTVSPDAGRCPVCGRRHLDMVMAQVLDLLIDAGLKPGNAALKDAGTPLVAFGVDMLGPPRLGKKDLVLVLDDIDRKTAEDIMAKVPEIKGVIRRYGGPRMSVGLMDTDQKPHLYELQAGCDVRGDVLNSLTGDFCFYRRQSVMHIEYWRNNSVKIKMLEKMFLQGDLAGKTVVDGMASAGTLGLMAAAAGAKKAILNDAWLPAVESILWNIDANQALLGVRLERLRPLSGLPDIGGEPELIARASGSVELEVYHGDVRKLPGVIKSCDVCILDPFPGMPAADFAHDWQDITKDKIVVL